MQDGKRARLYCCHSLLTRDALDELHVLSVGVDLLPALDAQGFDGESVVAAVAEACRRGGGDGKIPERGRRSIRAASQVLNIAWIADALDSPGERHLPAQRRLSAAAAGQPDRGVRIARLGREIAPVVGEPGWRIGGVGPVVRLRRVEAAGGPLIELRFIEARGRVHVQIRARVGIRPI
jgi:hypothetical protein